MGETERQAPPEAMAEGPAGGHQKGGGAAPDLPDLVPARMLNEFAYCPRLCYLEWVQGEFQDNTDTVEGRFQHRRVDVEEGPVPPGDELSKALGVDDTARIRSVTLSGTGIGAIARIDLVEMTQGNLVVPVDYKRGRLPEGNREPWEPEKVQLCVQGLILRENGFKSNYGILYYADSRRRIRVEFTEDLVSRTLELLSKLRETVSQRRLPPPLQDSPKCIRCSLAGICLPDETNLLTGQAGGEIRRLVPARSDAGSVYVQTQGMIVGKRGDVLEFRERGATVQEVRLLDVAQLAVYGNVQVTAQALRELCSRGIPVCHHSYGGWFFGLTTGLPHKNVELRIAQYRTAFDGQRSLALAREFVAGKIRNCRTMLRRNSRQESTPQVRELAALVAKASEAPDLPALLGVEGAAAHCYFSCFTSMLRPKAGQVTAFDFRTRNRRPPQDPVNAMLSFVYSLLAKDLTVTVLAVGFDPLLGFFHQPRYGRPALALDLMEEFRPILGDSVVVGMVNNGEVADEDFVMGRQACMLTPNGRSKVINAYERRLDTLVRHPVFGYSVSYRRILEVQARLLARCLLGELPGYRAFTTR